MTKPGAPGSVGRQAQDAVLLATDHPAPGHRVKAAFGVASDRLTPSLDPATTRLGFGVGENDGQD
ncbi:MAG: hypothetical protein J2P27_00070 [Actinobacteria bacterium]|nr:hypothetical protein [Actinomycetota bacterium]